MAFAPSVSAPVARASNRIVPGASAASRAASRSARWIVSCGAPYFASAAALIGRREVSWPVSHMRLMRNSGWAAVWRSLSPTPAASPSRAWTAFGVRFMSAPVRPKAFACSWMVTSWPRACRAMAAVMPPTPAPAIAIFKDGMGQWLLACFGQLATYAASR